MKEYIENGIEFAEYIRLIDELLQQGKTTGPVQSEEMFGYAKLNRQRMKRLGNTVELNESLLETVRAIDKKIIWLVITEGWCGDAAQNLPVIEKIAHENSNIRTVYLLRDENLDLMDRFLTNGARSIPKLISLDAETLEVLGTWGPRPAAAMDYFLEMRSQGLEKPEMMERLQRWYINDKERSIQKEFEQLLNRWAGDRSKKAVAKLSPTLVG
ncbi:MAG: thioredoxin family protein [Pyrinomonadaceae bacterium]|nr:thioredoxin family protein [Pyrinomonadaceae bacterium]